MKIKTERTVLRIGGMTCISCQNRIEKKLNETVGIEEARVNYNTGTAAISYNAECITLKEISAVIEELDYRVLDDSRKTVLSPAEGTGAAGTVILILALYMLARQFGISTLTAAFPLAEEGMGYGMLFIIGLITSVHCIAMCGGINLSQCIPGAAEKRNRTEVLFPSLLYNGGRVVSYTIVGAVVGALGQVITLSGRLQGLVQLAAGLFMVVMGINMLGIFPALRRFSFHLPRVFTRKIEEKKNAGKNPLIVGLLNGLMPCGPLQAMQLYALSTGNPISGAISMFLFSLGTVPLMFFIGALSSVLSKSFTARMMKIGAVLVTVLGLTMFSNGWTLSGFLNPLGTLFASSGSEGVQAAAVPFEPLIVDGVQIVNSTLSGGRYPAITVQEGIPVRWKINAPPGSINGCNNRMIIREYGIEHRFTTGENIVEFTPTRTGKIPYSCWMGMIRSSITVAAPGELLAAETEVDISPRPAGVSIAAEELVVAKLNPEQGFQEIKINLRDSGLEPAVIVVQRNVPAAWIINNDSLDPGNNALIFPLYYTQIDMDQGDNAVEFIPDRDFEFSTVDNIYYGYVKVVDDINNIDVEAIKAEAAAYETLIYPEAYFSAGAGQGGGCCASGGY
jgi:sulfite exporter TauE/SafE/copper chaperone CopZ/plastocyanin domain-containing protein